MLTTLLAVRINGDIAAARELFSAGWRTPKAMRESTWQQRVDALGRAHYMRYDESTACYLAEGAERVLEVYGGDLRGMAEAADRPTFDRRALSGAKKLGLPGDPH